MKLPGQNKSAAPAADAMLSRRQILKAALLGGAAIMAPHIFIPRRATALEPGATIHPEISPLRVVGIHDSRITSAEKISGRWDEQDPLVQTDVVHADLDQLACALAEEKDPRAAWKRIFLKPPGKEWPDAVVAVKTNEIAQQHTRSAVMSGVCLALVGLGVKPSNIRIYDACHGANITAFKNLPEGVVIVNTWGGMTVPISIPAPYKPETKAKCVAALAEDKVDILVNISMCKGHSDGFGKFTMTMKNHFGSITPGCNMPDGGGMDYLVGINKTPQILGKLDNAGKVLFPRQQLCIVDAIWASQSGPGGLPSAQPNRIFMGVCSPVVDYQVATNFRRDAMKWRINENAAKRLLDDFGFKRDDLPENGRIIEAAIA